MNWLVLSPLVVGLVLAANPSNGGGGGLRNSSSNNNNNDPNRQQQLARNLETTLRCGDCVDCNDATWNKVVSDYNGDFSCGARIDWVTANLGLSQYDACIAVAGNEFPTECGKACNPRRCDGRLDPYEVLDDPTPVQSGDLQTDANLYCFPPYNERQRYTNVWDNDFIMEVKETTSPIGICGPGDNHFSTQAVSYDAATEELTLEFKRQGGRWIGGEVRLVLPNQDTTPFHYGTYEWSLKSVKILNANTGLEVNPPRPLPPRLTIGLFTWDTTEDFAIRENRNHEVDIEVGQFGDIGGPDVNFLVQPPGKPQHGKFYSGGAPGSYDQSGYKWKFDWSPNQIEWNSDAAGGLSHLYSADIIQDYYSPAWLQCMPADVEIRMNLWSLDGTGTQLGLADDEMVQVVVDDFKYTPSGDTHVSNGGSCVKDCQCAPTSECNRGICESTSASGGPDPPTKSPTPKPTAAPVAAGAPTKNPTDGPTKMPTPPTANTSPQCSAHADCAARQLVGECCPTTDGTMLACCSSAANSPSPPTPAPPSTTNAMCSAHPECASRNLAGACCPTSDGTMLACCSSQGTTPSPPTPSPPTPSPPTPSPPSGNKRQCSANVECKNLGLAGDCCPTVDGTTLYCCDD